MSVTYPRGFRAAGVAAGLKPSGRPDLALLVGEPGTTAAGLFTTNALAAAPVELSRTRLATNGGAARAVLVNSGQANAATGRRGAVDASTAAGAAARAVGLEAGDVLACSTGVIGEPVHMVELLASMPRLAAGLSRKGGEDFARAILTTDTVDKQATMQAGPYRVGGCAKGVGMISPHLATMLAFLTIDAHVASTDLRRLASEQIQPRFDALTVDGCSSTNDTALLFASGAAGGPQVTPGSAGWTELSDAVGRVGEALVHRLIADGEGATHVMVIDVEGARSEGDAGLVATAIANSPLVKAALFGSDPNPGRLVQAVGASGATIDPALVDIWIGEAHVVAAGVVPPDYFAGDLRAQAQLAMKEPEVHIAVRLGSGSGRGRALGCDLSYEYVRINGEYTT